MRRRNTILGGILSIVPFAEMACSLTKSEILFGFGCVFAGMTFLSLRIESDAE